MSVYLNPNPYMNAALRGQQINCFNTGFHKFPSITSLINGTSEEIIHHIKQLTPLSLLDLSTLVTEIAMVQGHEPHLKISAIETILLHIGPQFAYNFISFLLTDRPHEFKHLLFVYENAKQEPLKTKLSLTLNKLIENGTGLVETFASKWMVDNTSIKYSTCKNAEFVNLFFEMIETKHLPYLAAKILYSVNIHSCIGITKLLAVLNNPSISQTFVDEWVKQIGNNWVSYKQLVVKLAAQIHYHKTSSFTPLFQLLDKRVSFQRDNPIEEIAAHIKISCDLYQQAFILGLDIAELNQNIARQYAYYPSAAARLISYAFKEKTDYLFRKTLLEMFIDKQFLCNIYSFYLGLIKNFPFVYFPYLFLASPSNKEGNFIDFFNSLIIKKEKILKKMGSLDPFELRFIALHLKECGELKNILKKIVFYIPSDDITTNFRDLCHDLLRLLSGLENANQTLKNIPYWKGVPSIFLSLGLFSDHLKPIILESFYHMNLVQRKAVATMLYANKDRVAFDTLLSQAQNGENVYNLIPKKILSWYFQEKNDRLKEKIFDFYARHAKLKKEISSYISDDSANIPPPPLEVFNYLKEEFPALQNFFNLTKTAPYQQLSRILLKKTSLNSQEHTFLAQMSRVKELSDKFASNNYGEILNQLEKLFPTLKPFEENELPPHFLAMLTPWIQNKFKLTGDIIENFIKVGISNENDLKSLGYKPEKEDLLHSTCIYILNNIPRDLSQQLANDCEDEWRRIYLAPFHHSFEANVNDFVSKTMLLKQPREFLITITTRVLNDMEKLSIINACHLSFQSIKDLQIKLTANATDQDIINVCRESLKLFMKAYRHHIIPTLGHYLGQKSLNTAWETLHKQGHTSLEHLIIKEKVTSFDMLFNLDTLANSLFTPLATHA